jgi:DNA topoisomerase-2
MKKDAEAEITTAKGEDYTKITFSPDLVKFKMAELDDDIIGLMSRRAYDIAGSVPGIKVFLNGKQLPCIGFKSYTEQYTNDVEVDGEPLKIVFEKPHDRWDVAVTVSNRGFQQVSFVNSISTTKVSCL